MDFEGRMQNQIKRYVDALQSNARLIPTERPIEEAIQQHLSAKQKSQVT